ncbi:acyl-CoA N-acyltransferase [Tilletiaria anomala UBC 951]|uniref:Glucosamine 6-phosphate N-acetyltransferase n=1 Tax=Tilletiaria anomala (strain ATCC 24038 / CBS 436.72 / UBC 951) TaxID=1037660 RepID=A0A066WQ61_TILAU|nr:acyl-CoA N-acyltransferase [Tilletiaria anomala UBC 951]KDN53144.1 acyl-CoA N-acyltransferase [Tilletiaria anomala UBC 951]
MPFTEDSQLDLAFDPSLIPQEIKDGLADGLHIRPLASTDYQRGHLQLLTVLTKVPDPGEDEWVQRFKLQQSSASASGSATSPAQYYTIAIISQETDKLVAVGTVLMEYKFIRGLGKVGHIEDIAVDANMQGKSLGKTIIAALTAVSEKAGAYKTILDCSGDNKGFYEKCGYKLAGVEMAKYTT